MKLALFETHELLNPVTVTDGMSREIDLERLLHTPKVPLPVPIHANQSPVYH